MQKRSIMHLAIAVFAICATALAPTTAMAATCYDRWVAKMRSVGAETNRLYALIKKTGDCSYVPAYMAEQKRVRATLRATQHECKGTTLTLDPIALVEANARKLCRTNLAQKPPADPSKKEAPSDTKIIPPQPPATINGAPLAQLEPKAVPTSPALHPSGLFLRT
jgi:hypothetical protein